MTEIINVLSVLQEKYQPSYECTVLTEVSTAHMLIMAVVVKYNQ